MSMNINGHTGPHPLNTQRHWERGNFGRNTAYNTEWYARQNPAMAQYFTQTVSPNPAQPKIADYFGLAEESIRIHDKDGSGDLDAQEMRKAFNVDSKTALDIYRNYEAQLLQQGRRTQPGTPDYFHQNKMMYQTAVASAQQLETFADNYVKALDVKDNNNRIGAEELAAFTLFQDDATNQFPSTVQAFEQNQLLPAGTTQQISDMVNRIRAEYGEAASPAVANGVITPAERNTADLAVYSMPNTVKVFLQEISNSLNIQSRYQAFKQLDVTA